MPKIFKKFFIFSVILIYQQAIADTIITSGQSVFESNINLGCNYALNQARQQAQLLIGNSGLYSYQIKKCNSSKDSTPCSIDKFTSIDFKSVILSEKKVSENLSTIPLKKGNIYMCEVSYEFDVQPIQSNANFIFDFQLSDDVFIAPQAPTNGFIGKNDPLYPALSFNISNNQSFYLYLFQQLDYLKTKENIFLIYPNQIDPDVKINFDAAIPLQREEYAFKVSFPNDVEESSIIIPLIGILSTQPLEVPQSLNVEELGQLIVNNQKNIQYFRKQYAVYLK